MRRTWLPVVCLVPLLAALVVAQPPPLAPNPPGGLAPNPPPGAPGMPPPGPAITPTAAEDVKTLRKAKIGVDGPALVAYLRQNTTPPDRQERIHALIRRLGDGSYAVRQAASAELAGLGAAAVPYLRHALGDPDEEVKERAENLLKDAEGVEARAARSAAAARLLRERAPAVEAAALLGRFPDGAAAPEAAGVLAAMAGRESDAAAALLAFLPDAESDAVEDEVVASLAALAVHDGRVDAAVVAALKDKVESRRGAAAVVVGRSGTPEQRAAVQALLTDADPRVRFRAAQGLLAGRDRAALPALVALVKDGPPDLAYQADELLSTALGTRVPHTPYGDDTQSRQACKKFWATWAQHAASADLSRAAVDLPPFNPALRARDVVRQCFNAVVKSDVAAFKQTCDVPFHLFNDQTHVKRDELDQVFNNNPMGVQMGPFYPLVVGAAPLPEFGLATPGSGGMPTPDDRAFLTRYVHEGEVIVLVVQAQQVGQPVQLDVTNGHLFLVRLTGDGPRVIGLNQNRQQIRYY